nr:hypothetical protein [Tanacetum cinerariifolium]
MEMDRLVMSGPISYVNVVHREPMSLMNGGEKVGNDYVNEFPSYATKLRLTSSTKANLRKHEANAPNDVDYDVWLTLASVNEVNDRMKNSHYGYFIGKKACIFRYGMVCAKQWEIYGFKKVTMVKGFLFFKFSSIQGVDFVLHEGNGYMKEKICIKYEWKPPHCSTCLIYGHSLVNCSKVVPKRVRNNMDQGKGQTSQADDEGFIEVKKKKPCSNGGTKTSNRFRKATTSGTQAEGQSSTHIVEKINVFEKQILVGRLALVDDDVKPLEKADHPVNSDSDDDVEPAENESANFFASNGVGYSTKSLWE